MLTKKAIVIIFVITTKIIPPYDFHWDASFLLTVEVFLLTVRLFLLTVGEP